MSQRDWSTPDRRFQFPSNRKVKGHLTCSDQFAFVSRSTITTDARDCCSLHNSKVMQSRSPSPENDIFASSYVPEREARAPSVTSIDFKGLLTEPLQLHEDLANGCGGQLWPAGMTLARYILQYHHDLQNKTVLEIGAGGGLTGLAVAKGCINVSGKLLVTDQIPMFSLMKQNIELNELTRTAEAIVYDWGESIPTEVSRQLNKPHPDIVLAADCVYFEPAFPLLLHTLKDIIGPNTTCFFCFKKRRKADMRFIRDLKKIFNVVDVEYAWQGEDRKESVFLYQVTLS